MEMVLVDFLIRNGNIGKENGVTATNIRLATGIRPVKLRTTVNTLRYLGYPVCSGSTGYYIASTVDEVKATISHLEGRIKGITQAVDGLKSFLKEI